MSWSTRIRQSHRWLSIAFTAMVILNMLVQGQEQVALVVGMLTLLPLALLLFSGLYLFILPYTAKRRRVESASLG